MANGEQYSNELGALWINHKHGPAMTGTINGVKVVVWRNKFKEEGDRRPDYRVMQDTGTPPPKAAPVVSEQNDDDIPF